MPNIQQNNTSVPDIYSGVALSYGHMPIPYQQQQSSNPPTPESPQTTPYPLTNTYPNLSTETDATLSLDSRAPKVDLAGKLFQKNYFLFLHVFFSKN